MSQPIQLYNTPRFATLEDRDRAFAGWVAFGGAMTEGMRCQVGGAFYRYTGGSWGLEVQSRGVRP